MTGSAARASTSGCRPPAASARQEDPALPAPAPELIHASTVAIDGRAVLIAGPSGSGKSDLALRLVDRGAMLVSDDYTLVQREGDALVARAPATIAGRIEIRGLGIVAWPHVAAAPVALWLTLDPDPPRLPEPRSRTIAGVAVRLLSLDPRPPSAPIVVEVALRAPAGIAA